MNPILAALCLVLLAAPVAAQPIIIPLQPQRPAEPPPPPPSPVPVAPPQADASPDAARPAAPPGTSGDASRENAPARPTR